MAIGHDGKEPVVNMETSSETKQADSTIDYTKPMLSQVGQLGTSYDDWVHSPKMQKTFRMFHLDFFEMFSSTPWYVIPTVWIPISTYLLMASSACVTTKSVNAENDFNISISNMGAMELCGDESQTEVKLTRQAVTTLVLFGIFMWTLLEYVLHRFLFHATISGTSEFVIRFHFLLHGQHHKFPMDKGRLVFPVVPASVFVSLFYIGYRTFLSAQGSCAVLAGTLIGYVCYDMMHYYTHWGRPSKDLAFGLVHNLKTSHMQHHFRDTTHGYGISSHIWDYFLGTLHPEKLD